MAKTRKKKQVPTHPLYKDCKEAFDEFYNLDSQISEQWTISNNAKQKAQKLTIQRKTKSKTLHREIARAILARDLNLTDSELEFLSLKLPTGKKNERIGLLHDLVQRNMLFPKVNSERVVSLSKVYEIIGFETNLSQFIKNLNKKLDGLVNITHKVVSDERIVFEGLKSNPNDTKTWFELKFANQKP